MPQIPSLNQLTKQNVMRKCLLLKLPWAIIAQKWREYVRKAEAHQAREREDMYTP